MFERKQPKVSIIIPNWFTPGMHGHYGQDEVYRVASRCLKRLIEATPRDMFELILINNGGTLTSQDLTHDLPTMKWFWAQADILIKNSTNLGFGPSCNQGFYLARGEYIICMNNDVFVWEDWLDAILKTFDENLDPPVGLAMPNIIKKEFQKDCLTEKGRLDMEKVFALKKEEVNLRNAGIYEPGAEFGSCWCAKRELLEQLKRKDGFIFDEQFLCGMVEDRDLYKRVRLAGYQTYRTNNTRVAHVGNLTITKIPNRRQYTEANREKLKKKWGIDKYK